jgi:hypothetical protein
VQQHQRAGTLGIERTAVQEISERADRSEAVVQRVEDVCGALVYDDVLDIR